MNRKTLRDNKRGAAIPHLDKKLFFNFIFPIPSLAEQKRIVEKVDELMARVADLEQSADALASLKKAFPDDIKASLLQAAMQGKLTKQLPEDGSAEELLEEIKAEKEKLIAEGKIKKQKSLAPIADDEVPFSIPENWKWVNLEQVATLLGGNAFKSNEMLKEQKNGYVRVIRISDFNDDGLVEKAPVFIADNTQYDNYSIRKDDILMCMTGGTVGKCCILKDCRERLLLNQRVANIRVFPSIDPEFIHKCLTSPAIQQAINLSKNSTNDNISAELIRNFAVPLPPLAEQKRIVERLENLMQIINTVGDLIASE